MVAGGIAAAAGRVVVAVAVCMGKAASQWLGTKEKAIMSTMNNKRWAKLDAIGEFFAFPVELPLAFDGLRLDKGKYSTPCFLVCSRIFLDG